MGSPENVILVLNKNPKWRRKAAELYTNARFPSLSTTATNLPGVYYSVLLLLNPIVGDAPLSRSDSPVFLLYYCTALHSALSPSPASTAQLKPKICDCDSFTLNHSSPSGLERHQDLKSFSSQPTKTDPAGTGRELILLSSGSENSSGFRRGTTVRDTLVLLFVRNRKIPLVPLRFHLQHEHCLAP